MPLVGYTSSDARAFISTVLLASIFIMRLALAIPRFLSSASTPTGFQTVPLSHSLSYSVAPRTTINPRVRSSRRLPLVASSSPRTCPAHGIQSHTTSLALRPLCHHSSMPHVRTARTLATSAASSAAASASSSASASSASDVLYAALADSVISLPAAVIDHARHCEQRNRELDRLLADPLLPAPTLKQLSSESRYTSALADTLGRLRKAASDARELRSLLAQAGDDEEMKTMAAGDLERTQKEIHSLEQQLLLELLPPDDTDERSVILEVRAGTGGSEAQLFARDVYHMYEAYASLRGWKFKSMQIADTEIGGYREASASVSGAGAYGRLKYESGVHRVQRIPETETLGRVHTSTITVATLPEAKEVDVAIDEKDLKIDVMRAQGAGGQHVNKTESAVRITHLPTAIVVTIQDDRSQHRNRSRAMTILRARLYELRRNEEREKRSAARREQTGTGSRSERIRTYNFPQGRITDHRTNSTKHEIERMLRGELLDEFIDGLRIQEQQERIADMLESQGVSAPVRKQQPKAAAVDEE